MKGEKECKCPCHQSPKNIETKNDSSLHQKDESKLSLKDSNVPRWEKEIDKSCFCTDESISKHSTLGCHYDKEALKSSIRSIIVLETAKERVKVIEAVNGLLDHYTVKCIESRRQADLSRKQFMELLYDRIRSNLN